MATFFISQDESPILLSLSGSTTGARTSGMAEEGIPNTF
jgi:hypothetical protein